MFDIFFSKLIHWVDWSTAQQTIANAKSKMGRKKIKNGTQTKIKGKEKRFCRGSNPRPQKQSYTQAVSLGQAECVFHFKGEISCITSGTCVQAWHTAHVPKFGRQYASNSSLHREGSVVASCVVPRQVAGTPPRAQRERKTILVGTLNNVAHH